MRLIRLIPLLLVLIATPVYALEGTEEAFSPHQGATALVNRVIGEAKESIHVAAYTFTSKPIADALIWAHDNGVEVMVVLDAKQTKSKRSLLPYLLGNGVPTRINRHYAIMHNKFMVIDGKILELGSFNYTKSAEERNAENVLVIRNDLGVVKNYDRQWQKLWDEADEVPLSEQFVPPQFRK
jgi:phosphatidylserine/phosphatidylglycerophosphate/cardiolipin synthase-like enzyme